MNFSKYRKLLLTLPLLFNFGNSTLVNDSVFAEGDEENYVYFDSYSTDKHAISCSGIVGLNLNISLTEPISALSLEIHYPEGCFTFGSNSYSNYVENSIYDCNIGNDTISISYVFNEDFSGSQLGYFSVRGNSNSEVRDGYFYITVTECYDSNLNEVDCCGKSFYFYLKESTSVLETRISSSSNGASKIGEIYSIKYSLNGYNCYDVRTGQFIFIFDRDHFEVDEIQIGQFFNNYIVDYNIFQNGEINFSFVGDSRPTSLELFTINLKIISNKTVSTIVELTPSSLCNYDLESIQCSSVSSTINLEFNTEYDIEYKNISLDYSLVHGGLDLDVFLDENSNLGAGDFTITFDPDTFTYDLHEKKMDFDFFNINVKDIEDGILKFSIINLTDVVAGGNILEISFTHKPICLDSSFDFTISGYATTDSMTNPITLNYIGSSVSIIGKGHLYGTAVSNNNGTHTFNCENCDDSYSESCEFTSEVTQEPTCTEDGIRTYTCSECGYSYTENIPQNGHNFVDTIVDPTCTEQGYTLHECSECDYSYKNNYVSANGHHYLKPVNNNNGTHTINCENCDDSYSEACVFSSSITKAPTCSEDGERTYVCSKCGYSYTEKIPQNGHNFVDTIVDPTCTEQGYTLHECTDCDYSYKDNYVSPTGHHYLDPVSNNNGTHTHNCEDCDNSYVESCHFESVITKDPTCDENGIRTYTCTECGYTFEESISNLGHSYIDSIIEPTCTEPGYTLHSCTECDYSYKDNYVSALGHTYDLPVNNNNGTHTILCKNCDYSYVENCHFESVVTKEPSCTEEGIRTYTCSECGYSYTEKIEKTKHNFVDTVVNPTCTEQGYTLHKCSECEYSYKDNFVSALGHEYNVPVSNNNGTHTYNCKHCDGSYVESCHFTSKITKDPSCTEEGIRTYTCSECGYSYTEVIPQKGHHYVDTIVEPTCSEQGYTLHSCTECDYSYKDNFVSALGHKYGDAINNQNGTHTYNCENCEHSYTENCYFTFVVSKEPTCTEDGLRTYTCSECGYSYTEKIPAKGHHLTETIVEATCTEQGYTLHSCTDCDYSYKDNFIDAKGHHLTETTDKNSVTHTCDICGYSYTESLTKGCKGSVLASSFVVTGLTFVAFVLITDKKKKNK